MLVQASTLQAIPPEKPGSAPVFIETTIENAHPWVGQEVLLTYTLFFSDTAPGIEDHTKPDHPGIWVQEVDSESMIRSTPASDRGIRLRKAVIRQLRVVPMQQGRLSVSNYKLKCLIPKSGELSLDSRNDTEAIVTAPPAIFQVRPLPKPLPAGFGGAVGTFSLAVSPETNLIHAGEPLTLLITLSGKGNLETQPALNVTVPEGLRYEASAVPAIVASGRNSTQSSVTTRITMMAVKAGSFRFRPVSLTFFNPETGHYDTIRCNEIAVRVSPATAISSPAQPAISAPSSAGHSDPWPPVMVTLSGLVLVLLFGLHYRNFKQKTEAPRAQSALKLQSVPNAPVQTTETRSSSLLKSPEALRSELFAAMKQLGIANPGGMTSKHLCRKLDTLNVAPQTVSEAGILLASIDQALYTPGKVRREQLEVMNRNTSRIITELLVRR